MKTTTTTTTTTNAIQQLRISKLNKLRLTKKIYFNSEFITQGPNQALAFMSTLINSIYNSFSAKFELVSTLKSLLFMIHEPMPKESSLQMRT